MVEQPEKTENRDFGQKVIFPRSEFFYFSLFLPKTVYKEVLGVADSKYNFDKSVRTSYNAENEKNAQKCSKMH